MSPKPLAVEESARSWRHPVIPTPEPRANRFGWKLGGTFLLGELGVIFSAVGTIKLLGLFGVVKFAVETLSK
jgi:hypothetical protein